MRAAPELDASDLGVAVVALLIHGRVLAEHLGAPHLTAARSELEAAVGVELSSWLGPCALDGEQVLFMVDILRRRGLDDESFLLSLSRVVEQAPDTANALRLLGDGCRRRRHWAAALQAYGSWRRVARCTDDLVDEVRSLHNLGTLHEDMGGYDEALDCHTHRRSLQVALGDRVSAAMTLVDIGRLHAHRGAEDRAVRCLERAVADLEAVGDAGSAVRALLAIASVRRGQGRRRDALTAMLRSLHLFGDAPEPGTSAPLWAELAALCEEDGLLETAGALHVLSQRDLGASGDREGEAASLRRLAWIRLLQSRTAEAANLYLASLALTNSRTDPGSSAARGSVDADAEQAAVRLSAPVSSLHGSATDRARDAMSVAMPLWRGRVVGADAVA